MTPFVADVLIPVGKIVAVFLYPMIMVVGMIWLERRVVALMQGRLGPNRVGFQGVLQPVADGVKLFFKEDIMQRQADAFLFNISPVLVMFSSLLVSVFFLSRRVCSTCSPIKLTRRCAPRLLGRPEMCLWSRSLSRTAC